MLCKWYRHLLQVFDGVDICRRASQEIQHFRYPVIAQYMHVVPMEWVGPSACLKLELYGCHVKGQYL